MNTTKLPRVARRALGVALASALMMIPCTTGIAAETSVPLDAAHFPDPAFRALVQQQDSDNDGVLSSDELHSIWKIEGGCYYDDTCGNITSAAGIEYFPSLTDLDLGGNQLTSLDVSHNPQLERLFVSDNQLKSIDLSHNPALAYLTLSDNQFTSIDISHNPALYHLYADGNQLTTVDVSNHAALATLDLHNNQLTHVNLEGTPKLDYLDIDNNSVLSVDLSQNAALNYLSLSNNQLTSVDLRHNTNLVDLYLDNNRLLWLGDVAKSVQFSDFSNQQFGPITDASLDLAKAAPGIDVSRISDVQGGTLQGTVLTPTSTDGLVTYDYHFSDAQMPLGVRVQFEVPSFTVAFDTNGLLSVGV
ncbi:Por secretion system C-terminal sorting domain-containing protein [Bifidobacterium italicum]|uniref:Por secretion system C-terminal sorting domain-containing protein n=1 Tax=Bifidobacterium italicum TaxID=1960968 RepID=A0A2A2EJW6_9BIFI|nr:leucine-rich repeat domain-containing protein [Bifidobacterium italicum]PAU69225.1 Por secretion system C-terminal sorting domain-containing protein [Bifidobacterium italicum]